MLDKLAVIEERYEEINQMFMEVGDDYRARRRIRY